MIEPSSLGPLDPEGEDQSEDASIAPARNLNVNRGVQGGSFVNCDLKNTIFNLHNKSEKDFSQNYQKIRIMDEGYFGNAWIVKAKNVSDARQEYLMQEIDCSEEECLKTGKEIEILAKCVGTNLVCLINSYYERSKFLIIMDYCSGESLAEFINAQRELLHLDKILEWFRQITSGVFCIHKMNIIYIHLKPSNIVLTSENLKISNFGIAKELNKISNIASKMAGTDVYMAPEILRGEEYDTMADMWSLGVIIFVITTLIGEPSISKEQL